MVTHVYLPAVFGGPLRWWKLDQWALPTPAVPIIPSPLVLAGLLVNDPTLPDLVAAGPWSLVVFFLGSDVLLVVAGRASFVGALISPTSGSRARWGPSPPSLSRSRRCRSSGAPEQVEVQRRGEVPGRPRLVTAAVVVVSALGLVSSTQYVLHWRDSGPREAYLAPPARPRRRLDADHARRRHGAARRHVGSRVSRQHVSHLLRPTTAGALRRRRERPDRWSPRTAPCPSRGRQRPGEHGRPAPSLWLAVEQSPVTIPLDGPVASAAGGSGIGYPSSGDSPVRVTAGDVIHDTTVRAGARAVLRRRRLV